jgi:hypothetical protein
MPWREDWPGLRDQKHRVMMVGMAAGNVTLAFGNRDFWPEVVDKYQEFFTRSGRLQEAVREMCDRRCATDELTA